MSTRSEVRTGYAFYRGTTLHKLFDLPYCMIRCTQLYDIRMRYMVSQHSFSSNSQSRYTLSAVRKIVTRRITSGNVSFIYEYNMICSGMGAPLHVHRKIGYLRAFCETLECTSRDIKSWSIASLQLFWATCFC